MSDRVQPAEAQVDRNFEAFQKMLPELMATHAGKIALLSDGEIVSFFDSYGDAMQFGMQKFGTLDRFSLQEVANRTVSLGIYSYAGLLQ